MLRLLVIFLMLCSTAPLAHQMSTAYVSATVTTKGLVSAQWQLRFFDLEQALSIDSDKNGELLWQEVLLRQAEIDSYLLANINILRDGQSCPIQVSPELATDEHFNEGYLLMSFTAACGNSGAFELNYRAIFPEDGDHKALLNISGPQLQLNRVLTTQQQSISFNIAGNSQLSGMLDYIYQGIVHILIGFDHILFLLALLITSVLERKHDAWVKIAQTRRIIINTACLLTSFTLAHSLTLSATAMNWISFNSSWVELGIALSVLFTAMNNLLPLITRMGILTFAFGLLHGMGFASVLLEVGLPAQTQLLSILSFNLGVEIGQLLILALVLPLLLVLRHFAAYPRYVMPASSVLIGIMAMNWAIQRW
jgi:hypothetical protein